MTDGIHRCAWLENTEKFGQEWGRVLPVARTISLTRLPKDAARTNEWILQLCRLGETTVPVRFCPFCGAELD